MPLERLIELSRRYGGNPAYVLAGGGNTSYKDEAFLCVKRSGAALADITAEGFVRLERAKLGRVFEAAYPAEPQAREAAVLRDMLAARCAGEEHKRPSVEALLHHLLPFTYVLHVHPARANGLTCGQNGEEAMRALFPGEAVWIPQTMPGYVLAMEARRRLLACKEPPGFLFLENHGVFIGGGTVHEIDNAIMKMDAALDGFIKRTPDFSACAYDREKAERFGKAIERLAGCCVFRMNRALARVLCSREAFSRVRLTFTPDHMVYCGEEALFVESIEELAEQARAFEAQHGHLPGVVGLRDTGICARGETRREAETAAALFLDALQISVYAESFGGAKPMEPWLVDAIGGWEAERFRKGVHGRKI